MAAGCGWRAARGRRRRGRDKEEEEDDEGGTGTSAVLRRLREARDDLLSSGFWAASAGERGAGREGGGNGQCGSSADSEWARPRRADPAVPSGAVRAPLSGPAAPPAQCVCLGLGRFAACPIARCQLAFLLLLLEELREGKHGVGGSATLFYMVHCGKALYNNLLWSNWSPAALSKVVIIGNSFRGIEERLLSRILERDYSYIAKVLKGTEEVALPSHPRYLDTFNDTSVHWFPLDKLQQLSPDIWNFVEEPTYQDCEDLEIIRNQDRAAAQS
ncbi:SRR1 domain containing [Willisornis vidua]|uniref:SRR1 domain containing n=1 Tax=Willisornis vidua TaxID=1566151 RepID=A0ABQ9D7F6_9PASS|nr:SRR1 domain containing [Willisornis vidua]